MPRALLLAGLMALSLSHPAAADNAPSYRLDIGTSVRGGTLAVEPQVNGPPGSVLRYELDVRRQGPGKSSDASQSGTLRLDDRGKARLATNAVNVAPGDSYEVKIRLFDAGRLVAEQSARHP